MQGTAFTKNSLRTLLTSPLYVGKMHAEGELHEGVHQAIVDEKTWAAVQEQLAAHRPKTRPKQGRTKTGALLQGLLRCGVCGAAMGPHSTRRHGRLYVSYVCQTIQKQGARACPGSRAAAHEIDAFVVGQLQALGSDAELQAETVAAAKTARKDRLAELRVQEREARADIKRLEAERKTLADESGKQVAQRRDDIALALERAQERLTAAGSETTALKGATLKAADLRAALESFVPVWDALFPAQRARVINLLIERVTYNAAAGELSIEYRPGGIRALAAEAQEAKA